MKQLKEDYKSRLKTINENLLIYKEDNTDRGKEINIRLKTKASEYRTFIAELERIEKKMDVKGFNAVDKLLGERENIKASHYRVNRLIKEGLDHIKDFPKRWYVRKPDQNVLDYLNQKYGKELKELKLEGHIGFECGFGELHGEFAFVPHDIDYSWEITQEEFNQIILNKKMKA